MKYCSNCKRVVFSENKSCECGKKLSDKIDYNAPVLLIAADEVNRNIIEHTLIKEKIPYSEKVVSRVIPVYGVEDGKHIYYVPIGFLKKAIDVLSGVSAMEIPEYYSLLDLPEEPEWEEMSPFKRNAVRALSAIGFIIIVFLCVTAVDVVANLFTKLF